MEQSPEIEIINVVIFELRPHHRNPTHKEWVCLRKNREFTTLAQAFGEQALDLVIDDASHLLGPSSASFEMIFPRLRDGGLYILEDWSSEHLL